MLYSTAFNEIVGGTPRQVRKKRRKAVVVAEIPSQVQAIKFLGTKGTLGNLGTLGTYRGTLNQTSLNQTSDISAKKRIHLYISLL
jgi:hypothetical protein